MQKDERISKKSPPTSHHYGSVHHLSRGRLAYSISVFHKLESQKPFKRRLQSSYRERGTLLTFNVFPVFAGGRSAKTYREFMVKWKNGSKKIVVS